MSLTGDDYGCREIVKLSGTNSNPLFPSWCVQKRIMRP